MTHKTLHTLIWLCGLFYGLVPFLKQHSFGESQLYLGESYFGSHILISLGLAAAGSSIWGGMADWLGTGDDKLHKAKTWMLATIVGQIIILACGFFNILTGYSYLIAGGGLMATIVFCSIYFSHHPTPTKAELKKLLSWLTLSRPWNGPFFLALYALLLWHNYQLVSGMIELDGWHKFSLFINRMFTQLALTGVLYFAVQFSIDTGPRWNRLGVWAIASLAPIAILIDRLMHGFWNQTFLGFLNKLGSDGLRNFDKELKGGGVDLSIISFLGITSIIIALFCAITYFSSKLAKKWKFRAAPVWIMVAVMLGVSGSVIEQAIGKTWKSRRNWMQEYMEFDLQLSPVRPPKGLAHFDVEFRDHQWLNNTDELKLKKQPDIYLIFVESFRSDALRSDVTPFLHRLAEDEAQPIGHTWAASNGTHLSWFATMTSQTALQREHSRDQAKSQHWPGLKSFHLLRDAGYQLSMYGASDLAFRDIGPHFFGENGSPFELVRENIESDPIFDLPLPERERMLFSDLKSAVSERKSGGHLDIVTIDSTHYKYTWHSEFTPPFEDYYPHAFFPATPTEEETRLIKNQYFNSLAWADHLAEDFCQHLKDQGKYDDSIVIILGDHGEEFQDHGGWLHVSSLEDEQVKVPMLIKWPNEVGRGPELAEASHLDLIPSILSHLTGDTSHFDTAGISLLDGPTERTSISTTAQGGVTDEAMLLTRAGYKAYFTWPHYFDGRPSQSATLTRLVGPEGDIVLSTSADYAVAIKQFFPDAQERFFVKFELKEQ